MNSKTSIPQMRTSMSDDEIVAECLERLSETFMAAYDSGDQHDTLQLQNLSMAMRWAWERKELGSHEAWVFAHVHNTPIVPPGHCGHPHELIKRGWKPSDSEKSPISISRWPQGTHFYATVGGETVQDGNGNEKWNTYEQAFNAAVNFRTLL